MGCPAVIPDQGENGPNPNPLSLGDRFGWSVGGTSNGVIVVGASWEDLAPTPGAPDLPQTGWAAVIRVKDSSTLGIGNGLDIEKVLEASESKLMGNANALRRDAFFGGVITKARPAFVPRTNAPPRYAGKLVLAGGTRFDCLPDTHTPRARVGDDCSRVPLAAKREARRIRARLEHSVSGDRRLRSAAESTHRGYHEQRVRVGSACVRIRRRQRLRPLGAPWHRIRPHLHDHARSSRQLGEHQLNQRERHSAQGVNARVRRRAQRLRQARRPALRVLTMSRSA